MSDKTATSLFMFSPLTSKYAGFYQQLLKGLGSYERLGNRLIQLAEQAHAFRQFDRVNELGLILSNLPVKEYQTIGLYFLGVAANSMGNGDQERAQKLFETVANSAPDKYKGKAIMSLAALAAHKKDYGSELYFFRESLKAGKDLYTILKAHKGIAVIQAREGSHRHSLKYLETFLSLIKYAEPQVYFDYLNSYAVELSEAGRKQEARNISQLVMASPFAPYYPEWHETARDLKQSSRSFIAVPLIEREHVRIEPTETKHASKPEHESDTQPASVLSFPKLREAPQPEKPEKLSPQEYARLTTGDKRELILAAVKSGAIGRDDYYKMMVMLGLVTIGPSDKILDLEDEEILDDIAVIWSVQIGREEFVGFLSALRDCEDSLRQKDILDRLITKIFHETQLCGITEDEWRLKVERRLPEK